MNTTKEYNPGDTICTCRIGEDRYEIKRAILFTCGADRKDYNECAFCSSDCELLGVSPFCNIHNIYFIKIQPKEQQ